MQCQSSCAQRVKYYLIFWQTVMSGKFPGLACLPDNIKPSPFSNITLIRNSGEAQPYTNLNARYVKFLYFVKIGYAHLYLFVTELKIIFCQLSPALLYLTDLLKKILYCWLILKFLFLFWSGMELGPVPKPSCRSLNLIILSDEPSYENTFVEYCYSYSVIWEHIKWKILLFCIIMYKIFSFCPDLKVLAHSRPL